jgi:DNA-binding NtrC family response regulator
VLIVNPDPDMRLSLTDGLTANGYHVESVQDGKTCLQRIQERVFNAVLLSEHLPDQDGLSLLEAIHTSQATLPVILLTVSGPSPSALQRGACAVLLLPYQRGELLHILQKAIGQ